MRVYLAGGIFGLDDSQAKDWREYAKREIAGYCIDPMRRDYRGQESDAGIAAKIVSADIRDIDESDYVLAMCPKPSWGTAMEIMYASLEGIPVYAVVPEGKVSPWLIHHARIFTSLDDAIDMLNRVSDNVVTVP